MLERAISLATEYHTGQYDRAGKPYILHPLRVMTGLDTDDEELLQIGVLHDIVEDTNITLLDLELEGFSKRVVEGVDSLTKRKEENMDYHKYLKRLSDNPDAILVKIKDLEHNMDLTRLPYFPDVTSKDLARLNKYKEAKQYLEGLL